MTFVRVEGEPAPGDVGREPLQEGVIGESHMISCRIGYGLAGSFLSWLSMSWRVLGLGPASRPLTKNFRA